jgi:hypothetical protein
MQGEAANGAPDRHLARRIRRRGSGRDGDTGQKRGKSKNDPVSEGPVKRTSHLSFHKVLKYK